MAHCCWLCNVQAWKLPACETHSFPNLLLQLPRLRSVSNLTRSKTYNGFHTFAYSSSTIGEIGKSRYAFGECFAEHTLPFDRPRCDLTTTRCCPISHLSIDNSHLPTRKIKMRTPSHDLHNFPDHNFIPSSLSHWTRVHQIPILQIVICNLSSPTLRYPIPNAPMVVCRWWADQSACLLHFTSSSGMGQNTVGNGCCGMKMAAGTWVWTGWP